MDETYQIEGIVLKRSKFREHDSKVVLLTSEHGKLELVARGAMKIRSKLSGHIEPITYINGMAIKGKQYDYLGSAVGERYYRSIRSDLGKLSFAGKIVDLTDKAIKTGDRNRAYLNLLVNFLDATENKQIENFDLFFLIYDLKLLDLLGFGPELYKCLQCGQKLKSGGNYFSYSAGGVLCSGCGQNLKENAKLSDNVLKFLRVILDRNNTKITNIKISKKNINEAKSLIEKFIAFHR